MVSVAHHRSAVVVKALVAHCVTTTAVRRDATRRMTFLTVHYVMCCAMEKPNKKVPHSLIKGNMQGTHDIQGATH